MLAFPQVPHFCQDPLQHHYPALLLSQSLHFARHPNFGWNFLELPCTLLFEKLFRGGRETVWLSLWSVRIASGTFHPSLLESLENHCGVLQQVAAKAPTEVEEVEAQGGTKASTPQPPC